MKQLPRVGSGGAVRAGPIVVSHHFGLASPLLVTARTVVAAVGGIKCPRAWKGLPPFWARSAHTKGLRNWKAPRFTRYREGRDEVNWLRQSGGFCRQSNSIRRG